MNKELELRIACVELGIAMSNEEAVERYANKPKEIADKWHKLAREDAFERGLRIEKARKQADLQRMAAYVERHYSIAE